MGSIINIYIDAYVYDVLTARYKVDYQQVSRTRDKKGHRLSLYAERTRINVLDLVSKGRNLFVVGTPGAGKTTFCRFIVTHTLRRSSSRVPILVFLKDWDSARDVDLLNMVARQFDVCSFPDARNFVEQLLRAGALVIFDGLDEVKEEAHQRSKLTQMLNDFARKYSQSQIIITCRTAASDYLFDGFQDVEVAEFNREQIHAYSEKWFGKGSRKQIAFIRDLYKEDNAGLLELCSTPLLLSMLCLAFDETVYFSPHRAEIYKDAVEALLRKWDASRGVIRDEIYRGLSPLRKLQLFALIAEPAFREGQQFFRSESLERLIMMYMANLPGIASADIDARHILAAIESQHGILVQFSKGIYAFCHLTFQEYFTAQYIVDHQVQGTIKTLIAEHITDSRWREVFLIVASLLPNADDFLIDMKDRILSLIARDSGITEIIRWSQKKVRGTIAAPHLHNTASLAYLVMTRLISVAMIITLDQPIDRARSMDDLGSRDRAALIEKTSEYERQRRQMLASALAKDIVRARDIAIDIESDITTDNAGDSTSPLYLAFDYLGEQCRILAQTQPVSLTYVEANLKEAANIVNVLSTSYGGALAVDFGLICVWLAAYLSEKTGKTIHESEGMTYLVSLLHSLSATPDRKSIEAIRKLCTTTVPGKWGRIMFESKQLLLKSQVGGDSWDITTERIQIISNYLRCSELMVQCLKVAVSTNRQELIRQVLPH